LFPLVEPSVIAGKLELTLTAEETGRHGDEVVVFHVVWLLHDYSL